MNGKFTLISELHKRISKYETDYVIEEEKGGTNLHLVNSVEEIERSK